VATRITIDTTGRVLADRARWARTGKERRKGLIGSPPLEPGEGLIIDRSPQVHTFRMSWPIDVVFCTKSWNVKHIVRSMVPGRLSRIVLGARYAIELPAGTTGDDLEVGDRLTVQDRGE
jgi:uncharacterized membrane protein (UPF0127 family)